MKRALDDIKNISTDILKQRSRELNDEFTLVSKKNIKLQAAIMADKVRIINELRRRNNEPKLTF